MQDRTVVDCEETIVDNIIGKDSRIVSESDHGSKGRSFVVGESTYVRL